MIINIIIALLMYHLRGGWGNAMQLTGRGCEVRLELCVVVIALGGGCLAGQVPRDAQSELVVDGVVTEVVAERLSLEIDGGDLL